MGVIHKDEDGFVTESSTLRVQIFQVVQKNKNNTITEIECRVCIEQFQSSELKN